MGGWTGPEKISGPPTGATNRRVSSSGKVITPPAAAKDLLSDAATTVRARVSGDRCSRAYPRPCCPIQEAACASSTYSQRLSWRGGRPSGGGGGEKTADNEEKPAGAGQTPPGGGGGGARRRA